MENNQEEQPIIEATAEVQVTEAHQEGDVTMIDKAEIKSVSITAEQAAEIKAEAIAATVNPDEYVLPNGKMCESCGDKPAYGYFQSPSRPDARRKAACKQCGEKIEQYAPPLPPPPGKGISFNEGAATDNSWAHREQR